jgi:hypothetical protein
VGLHVADAARLVLREGFLVLLGGEPVAIEALATRSGLSIGTARQQELPQPELRDLFDSLRLQGAFQPPEAAVDVEVALFADEPQTPALTLRRFDSRAPGGAGADLGDLDRDLKHDRLGGHARGRTNGLWAGWKSVHDWPWAAAADGAEEALTFGLRGELEVPILRIAQREL